MSTGTSQTSVPQSSYPGRRGGPIMAWPGDYYSRGAQAAALHQVEDWSGSSALDPRSRPGSAVGPSYAEWGAPAAFAYGSPRPPTALGWSYSSARSEASFHPDTHLLGQQQPVYGGYSHLPVADPSYALHPSDAFFRSTTFHPAAPPQAIFRGSPTVGSHLPVTPPSPVASVGDESDDDGPARHPIEMAYGDPWTFQHMPVQPFAYPSSSLRRGAAVDEADTFDDDDETEIKRYLAGARSPPRVLMSSLVSRAPSPSPTSSLPSLTYSASDRSAADQGPQTSGGSSTPSPLSTGATKTVDFRRAASSTPSPAVVPAASVESRRRRRTRAEAASSLASDDAGPPVTAVKRSRIAEKAGASAPVKPDKATPTTASRSGTAGLAPPPKNGKRRGKEPTSCAECRRLKMRCNLKEQQPCSSCVARGCPTVCPHGQLANMAGKRLVLADTEALHARITALETALAISFAREDPTLEPVGGAEPALVRFDGQRVHPLLLAAFVDGGGGADESEAGADEVSSDE